MLLSTCWFCSGSYSGGACGVGGCDTSCRRPWRSPLQGCPSVCQLQGFWRCDRCSEKFRKAERKVQLENRPRSGQIDEETLKDICCQHFHVNENELPICSMGPNGVIDANSFSLKNL
ncbi:hypothetical protein ACF0H5_022642 [Mactra antiquata]